MNPKQSSFPIEKWKSEMKRRNIEIESDPVLVKCISFCEAHHIDIETFSNKFEAWALSHLKCDSTLVLNTNSVSEFLSSKANQLKENIFHANRTTGGNSSSSFKIASSQGVKASAPITGTSPSLRRGNEKHCNISDIFVWPSNEDRIKTLGELAENTSSPEISLLFDANLPQRYMRIIWAKVAKHINGKVEEFALNFISSDGVQWSHPGVPSCEPIFCYGRLVSDTDSAKWNDKSVILECSREGGSGCRVSLNLMDLSAFSFIPGQIVGLKGISLIDGFYPTELLPYIPLDRPISFVSELKDKKFNSVNLLCIAGPFALLKKSDSGSHLDYSPLTLLFDSISQSKKNDLVLLLLGPFIDSETAKMMTTSLVAPLYQSFEEMFREEISKKISRLLSNKIKVILMPSPSDLIHDFIFPQSSLSRDILSIPNDVILLPNPCFFCINELVFAVSTADILFDMSCNEISRGQTDIDRMTRLLKQLIHQRSFYPLYPSSQNVNLDLCGTDYGEETVQSTLLSWKVLPDILILPSALKHFVKTVDDVLCINPGTLVSKGGHSTGSFCEIFVNELELPPLDSDVVPHFSDKRSVVMIKSLSL